MTRLEAIYVLKHLSFYETFIRGDGIDSLDTVEKELNNSNLNVLDWIIDTLMTVDVDYKQVSAALSGEGTIVDMDGKYKGDDYDYIILDLKQNTFYIWTEVCGIEYDIKDLNKEYKIKV